MAVLKTLGLFLFVSVLAWAQEVETLYLEENGLVVIELEDGAGGLWEATDALPGAIGGQFLQWTGGQRFGTQTDQQIQPVGFKFKISNPGTYQMRLRSRQYAGVESFDAGNDTFFRFASGTNPVGAEDISRFTKFWVQSPQNWSWVTTAEPRHAEFERTILRDFAAGEHEIQIDGRSPRHAIDRIVLYRVGTVAFNQRNFDNYAPSETEEVVIPPVDANRINLGSGEDEAPFAADGDLGRGEQRVSISRPIDRSGVVDAAPAEVYQTAISAQFFSRAFTDLVPAKVYRVRVHLVETSATAAGQRVMDFAISRRVPDAFDQVDPFLLAGGRDRAIFVEDHVRASSTGRISVSFFGRTGLAQIAGVEVLDPVNLPVIDRDSDGLPDDWELTYYSEISSVTADSDDDGDGVSDLLEFLGGSSPRDAKDAAQLTLSYADGAASLEFQRSTPARGDLRLQKTPTLVGGGWTEVTEVDGVISSEDGDSVEMVRVQMNGSAERMFFRLSGRGPSAG